MASWTLDQKVACANDLLGVWVGVSMQYPGLKGRGM
jgi:hypothetical protein